MKKLISTILILTFALQSTNAWALRTPASAKTEVGGQIQGAMHEGLGQPDIKKQVAELFESGLERESEAIGVHGTSIEAIEHLIQYGRLPSTGRIRDKFFYYPFKSGMDAFDLAGTYAKWNSVKYYVANKLPFKLDEDMSEKLASFVDTTGAEIHSDFLKLCREHGVNERQLLRWIDEAIAQRRGGVLLLISKNILKDGFKVKEDDAEDECSFKIEGGLPLKYIIGIEPLGQYEWNALAKMQQADKISGAMHEEQGLSPDIEYYLGPQLSALVKECFDPAKAHLQRKFGLSPHRILAKGLEQLFPAHFPEAGMDFRKSNSRDSNINKFMLSYCNDMESTAKALIRLHEIYLKYSTILHELNTRMHEKQAQGAGISGIIFLMEGKTSPMRTVFDAHDGRQKLGINVEFIFDKNDDIFEIGDVAHEAGHAALQDVAHLRSGLEESLEVAANWVAAQILSAGEVEKFLRHRLDISLRNDFAAVYPPTASHLLAFARKQGFNEDSEIVKELKLYANEGLAQAYTDYYGQLSWAAADRSNISGAMHEGAKPATLQQAPSIDTWLSDTRVKARALRAAWKEINSSPTKEKLKKYAETMESISVLSRFFESGDRKSISKQHKELGAVIEQIGKETDPAVDNFFKCLDVLIEALEAKDALDAPQAVSVVMSGYIDTHIEELKKFREKLRPATIGQLVAGLDRLESSMTAEVIKLQLSLAELSKPDTFDPKYLAFLDKNISHAERRLVNELQESLVNKDIKKAYTLVGQLEKRGWGCLFDTRLEYAMDLDIKFDAYFREAFDGQKTIWRIIQKPLHYAYENAFQHGRKGGTREDVPYITLWKKYTAGDDSTVFEIHVIDGGEGFDPEGYKQGMRDERYGMAGRAISKMIPEALTEAEEGISSRCLMEIHSHGKRFDVRTREVSASRLNNTQQGTEVIIRVVKTSSLGASIAGAMHEGNPHALMIATRDPEVKLYCRIFGKKDGEPVIVLHGGPGFDHRYMLYGKQNPFQKLGEKYKVIIYDQRACGRSSQKQGRGAISLDRSVEDLEDLFQELGIKYANIIGHSWGAAIGMHYAARHPEKVASLILLDPAAVTSKKDYETFSINRQAKWDKVGFKLDNDSDPKYWQNLLSAYFSDKKKVTGFSALFTKDMIKAMRANGKRLARDIGNYSRNNEVLKQITSPTLIIYGQDNLTPVGYFASFAHEIGKHKTNARLVSMPQCGHFPFIEQDGKVFGEIKGFLEKTERKKFGVETSAQTAGAKKAPKLDLAPVMIGLLRDVFTDLQKENIVLEDPKTAVKKARNILDRLEAIKENYGPFEEDAALDEEYSRLKHDAEIMIDTAQALIEEGAAEAEEDEAEENDGSEETNSKISGAMHESKKPDPVRQIIRDWVKATNLEKQPDIKKWVARKSASQFKELLEKAEKCAAQGHEGAAAYAIDRALELEKKLRAHGGTIPGLREQLETKKRHYENAMYESLTNEGAGTYHIYARKAPEKDNIEVLQSPAGPDMRRVYVLIIAGGSGARLWPYSTKERPKALCSFTDDGKTLLKKTYERLQGFVPSQRILISAPEDLYDALHEELRELKPENFILEPFSMGFNNAMGLAAATLSKRDNKATMVVLSVDQEITDKEKFQETLRTAIKGAQSGRHLVVVGIKPTSAHTGFGYIESAGGSKLGDEMLKIKSFSEKPDSKTAEEYVLSGRFYWNATIFAGDVKNILSLFKATRTYNKFMTIRKAIGTRWEKQTKKRVFTKLEPDPSLLEYAKNEPSMDLLLVPGDFSWSDLGDWDSVARFGQMDTRGNIRLGKGETTLEGSQGCVVFSSEGQSVHVKGLKDHAVIVTDQACLVMPRASAQNLKKLVWEIELEQENGTLGRIKAKDCLNCSLDSDTGLVAALDAQNIKVERKGSQVWVLQKTQFSGAMHGAKKPTAEEKSINPAMLSLMQELLEITTDNETKAREIIDEFANVSSYVEGKEQLRRIWGPVFRRLAVSPRQAVKELQQSNKLFWLVQLPMGLGQFKEILNSSDERGLDVFKDENGANYLLLQRGNQIDAAKIRNLPEESSLEELGGFINPTGLECLEEISGHSHPVQTEADFSRGDSQYMKGINAIWDETKGFPEKTLVEGAAENFIISLVNGSIQMSLWRIGESEEFPIKKEEGAIKELARMGILGSTVDKKDPQDKISGAMHEAKAPAGLTAKRIAQISVAAVAVAAGAITAKKYLYDAEKADEPLATQTVSGDITEGRVRFFFTPHRSAEDFYSTSDKIKSVIEEAYGKGKHVYILRESNVPTDPPRDSRTGRTPDRPQWLDEIELNHDKVQQWLDRLQDADQEFYGRLIRGEKVPDVSGSFADYLAAQLDFLSRNRQKIHKILSTRHSVAAYKNDVKIDLLRDEFEEAFFSGQYDLYVQKLQQSFAGIEVSLQIRDSETQKQMRQVISADPKAVLVVILGSNHRRLADGFDAESALYAGKGAGSTYDSAFSEYLEKSGNTRLGDAFKSKPADEMVWRAIELFLEVNNADSDDAAAATKDICAKLSQDDLRRVSVYAGRMKAMGKSRIQRCKLIWDWLGDNGKLTEKEKVLVRPAAGQIKGAMHEAAADPKETARAFLGLAAGSSQMPENIIMAYSPALCQDKQSLRLIAQVSRAFYVNRKGGLIALVYRTEEERRKITAMLHDLKDDRVRQRMLLINDDPQSLLIYKQHGYGIRYFKTDDEQGMPGVENLVIPAPEAGKVTDKFEEQFKKQVELLIKA